MINGVHALIWSGAADEVRAFFRDVLELPTLESGGWPLFTLPPAELGVHPTEGEQRQELWLMCDDVEEAVAELGRRGVEASPVTDEGFGLVTNLQLPGGAEIGLYQPRHETALRREG